MPISRYGREVPSRVTRKVKTRVRSAWNAIVIMSVISLKCSAKSAGTPYGFSMCGSICALSFSAFSICRSISRMDERYSSSLRRSVGPEVGLELAACRRYEIEDAAAVLRDGGRALPASGGAVAEQPLKQRARIENRRQRLSLAPPRQVVGVGAGVAGIAIARLARVFHAEFERREARLAADVVGDDLIERNAGLDIDQRLARLHAGEVRAAAAAVIARAVEQRAARIVRQIPEQQ